MSCRSIIMCTGSLDYLSRLLRQSHVLALANGWIMLLKSVACKVAVRTPAVPSTPGRGNLMERSTSAIACAHDAHETRSPLAGPWAPDELIGQAPSGQPSAHFCARAPGSA